MISMLILLLLLQITFEYVGWTILVWSTTIVWLVIALMGTWRSLPLLRYDHRDLVFARTFGNDLDVTVAFYRLLARWCFMFAFALALAVGILAAIVLVTRGFTVTSNIWVGIATRFLIIVLLGAFYLASEAIRIMKYALDDRIAESRGERGD